MIDINDILARHSEHPWYQIGRCVYCGPCGERLYQGTLPKDHPVWTSPKKISKADEMRARWGMEL